MSECLCYGLLLYENVKICPSTHEDHIIAGKVKRNEVTAQIIFSSKYNNVITAVLKESKSTRVPGSVERCFRDILLIGMNYIKEIIVP